MQKDQNAKRKRLKRKLNYTKHAPINKKPNNREIRKKNRTKNNVSTNQTQTHIDKGKIKSH